MKVVAIHEDLLVATSAVWQTSAALVRAPRPAVPSGDASDPRDAPLLDVRRSGPAASGTGTTGDDAPREAFLVDSPVLPDELGMLPRLAEQAGYAVAGLLATHGDWDHLLGREAFPGAALGVAETTAARLTARPGAAQRFVRDFDDGWLVADRPRLGLGEVQALPVPGRLEVGTAGATGPTELELHPADGHTQDGMAVWVPWARTLLAGDYLSPVEIPRWHEDGGSRSAYRATLERLRPLVEAAEWVVCGHGGAIDGARALALLREDVRYVEDLDVPIARRSPRQLQQHAANRAAG